jgi:hypothetical protein
MLPSIPARGLTGIGDVLQTIEAPHDAAFEVDLYQIELILCPVLRIALAGAAKDLTPG